jgi:hypothetical protein
MSKTKSQVKPDHSPKPSTKGWNSAIIVGLVLLVLTMTVFAIDRHLNPYGVIG